MTEMRKLGDFAGHWLVSREISEATGGVARFEGRAAWMPADRGLAYRETGTMTLDSGAVFQAERRYFWAEDLAVHFDDGKFFHQVPAAGGVVRHWCDPDDYQLSYDFSLWPQFEVLWKVKGPRKDYKARTKYTRR